MTAAIPQVGAGAWLAGRQALLVGEGPAAIAVGQALVAAGASLRTVSPAVVDAAEIEALFDAAPVDLLVHAGTALPRVSPETVSLDRWRDTFSADLDGRFLFAAAFARRILADRTRHGAILLLMPGLRAVPGGGIAATAHGALDNLVKSLAVEWAREGIRVNAIASHVVADFAGADPAAQASLGHLATWLLSDYAAYMTGTVAGIDEL